MIMMSIQFLFLCASHNEQEGSHEGLMCERDDWLQFDPVMFAIKTHHGFADVRSNDRASQNIRSPMPVVVETRVTNRSR